MIEAQWITIKSWPSTHFVRWRNTLAVNLSTFVDTSAWYATVDRRDRWHQSAVPGARMLLIQKVTLLTTNHVVSETYTMPRSRIGFQPAQEFLRRVRTDPRVRRIMVPEAWEEAAEDLLARYADQDFSYVDASSFIAMRRLGLQEAFAYDHHFATAGFTLVGDSA